ncbi:MAG: glycosyltransferase family 39 protein [Candidatus Marinimicrobia bacterium]|nr:glycosyltransferase family 39 protein [Candidatus Neomarinimicrobiota bacterium]
MNKITNIIKIETPQQIMLFFIFVVTMIISLMFYFVHSDLYALISLIFYYIILRWLILRFAEGDDEKKKVLNFFHIALVIRLFWVFISSIWIAFDTTLLIQDSLGYDILAKKFIDYIIAGSTDWANDPDAYRAKGFNAYMGFIYLLFNKSALTIIIGNAFISSASASFLYLVGKRTFNENTGKIAAILVIIFIPSIIIDARVLKAALVFFLVSYMLLLIVEVQRKQSIPIFIELLFILIWLYFTRIYYAFFFLPALGFIIFSSFPRKKGLFGLAFFVILISAVIYQEVQTPASVTLIAMTETGWFQVTGNVAIDQSRGAGALIGLILNPLTILKSTINGAVFLFLKPIYFYVQGITLKGDVALSQSFWNLFSTLMWILMPGIVWAFIYCIIKLRSQTFFIYSFLFLAIPFFGLKTMTNRYKIGAYAIIFLLAAVGIDNRKKWLGWAPFYLFLVMVISIVMLEKKLNIFGIF